MKKLAGIFFLTIYVLGVTEFHQLLRIPFLVKHFDTHCQTDPEMNFAKFINIHYINPSPEADDYKQDQQLPFLNLDGYISSGFVFVYEPAVEIIQTPVTISDQFHTWYNETNKPQFSALSIFQPPRCA